MSDPCTPRSYVERHRSGCVGRIPSPTPFPVGDSDSYLVFPPVGSEDRASGPLEHEGLLALEREAGVERARIVERPA